MVNKSASDGDEVAAKTDPLLHIMEIIIRERMALFTMSVSFQCMLSLVFIIGGEIMKDKLW
ncbi:hypothetical protein BAOM_4494 [Peribacillus asahii]|uniref:Uncharacterized protein n=1 Tax=Peribacillus asahii TaxID=228899 RepID=A0A3Q9RRJ0_9BACI|nr:hypothetical protein BAOM_4494 [Peribacillus asahii]